MVPASLRAGIHYVDVTAEQASALATFDKFGVAAREAGVVVIPAMGFYGGLSDLLATAAMGDWDFADEIRIGIALDSWRPTQGTRVTGRRNTARRLVVADGRLTPLAQPAPDTEWDFPHPFGRQDVAEIPFSEIVVLAQHLRISHLHTYLNHAPLRDLRDPATPPPTAADATGRSAQTFLVDVIVEKGSDTRRATARGRDIYAFTAPLVCEAVQRIFDGAARSSSAHAPGALFDSWDAVTEQIVLAVAQKRSGLSTGPFLMMPAMPNEADGPNDCYGFFRVTWIVFLSTSMFTPLLFT